MRVPVLLVAAAAIALGACSGASATVAPSAVGTSAPTTAATATPSAPASVAAPSDGAATPVLSGPFTAAGVTHYVDPAATAVNPADFEVKVPSSSGVVYVVFALTPGTVGTVKLTITKGGQPDAAPMSLDYTAADSWGDFKLTFPSGDRTGDYVATITFALSGESVTLPFTVG